jgi:hypothetical protein
MKHMLDRLKDLKEGYEQIEGPCLQIDVGEGRLWRKMDCASPHLVDQSHGGCAPTAKLQAGAPHLKHVIGSSLGQSRLSS